MKNRLRKLLVPAVLFAFAFVLQPQIIARASTVELHVSADTKTASDSNNGLSPDKPFATIKKARDIAAILARQPAVNQVYVNIHAGSYYESVDFFAQHSGNVNGPITYRNYMGKTVNIFGSKRLSSKEFELVTDQGVLSKLPATSRGKVYQMQLPFDAEPFKVPPGEHGGSSEFYYELFVDKKPQMLARWPNGDTFARTGENTPNVNTLGKHTIHYRENTPSNWTDWANIKMAGYWYYPWSFKIMDINPASINKSAQTITSATTSAYGAKAGQRYYFTNVFEDLDIPGEWYIDSSKNILYYYASSNYAIQNYEISYQPYIFLMQNAQYINFEGLNFGFARDRAISIQDSHHINFTNNRIHDLGHLGINIKNCTDLQISNNAFYNVGGNAIQVSGGNRYSLTGSNISIDHNEIRDFGTNFRGTSTGVTILDGAGTRIAYNKIYNGGRAIYFDGNNHIIEYNNIYNIAGELGDAGAIYAGRSWMKQGCVIENNYIHDIRSNLEDRNYKIQAIYLDDCYSGVKISKNLFKNIERAVTIGGGRNITMTDNIIYDASESVVYDNRGIDPYLGGSVISQLKADYNQTISNAAFNKAAYISQYPNLQDLIENYNNNKSSIGNPAHFVFKRNVYYLQDAGAMFYEKIWNDVISMADEFEAAQKLSGNNKLGFVSEDGGDFSLSSSSSIFSIIPDFKPIDFSKIPR